MWTSRNLYHVLFVSILFGALCGAQAVQAIHVSGRVLAESGEPLAGATAYVTEYLPLYEESLRELDGVYGPPVVASVGADEEGWFRVEIPRPGMWGVRIEAPGYVPMYRWDEPVLEDLHLPRVELARDEGLEVRVTDPEGRPISSAHVRYTQDFDHPRPFSKGWRRLSQTELTDERGRVTLPRAEREVLRAVAWAPGWLASEWLTTEGEPLQLTLTEGEPRAVQVEDAQGRPLDDALVEWKGWPVGRTDETGSLRTVLPTEDRASYLVALAEDGRWIEERGIRSGALRLALPELLTIRGRVVDAESEAPVAGAVAQYGGWGVVVAETDRTGEFEMDLVPLPSSGESLPLRWRAAGYVHDTVDVSRNDPHVEVALEPARKVQGRVTTSDGEPVAGATVWVRPADDLQWRPHGYGIGSETTTQGEGKFLFRHVWRWKDWPTLEVEARAPGWAPVLGRVPAGRDAAGMALVLKRGAQVTGRVVDSEGAPIPEAPVHLYVEARKLSQRTLVSSVEAEPDFQAVAEADGTFRVTHLPVDRFEILIDPPGFGGRILRGVEIPVTGEVDLGQIELEPSGRITGYVLDPQDRALSGTRVTLLPGNVMSHSMPGHVPLKVTGGTSIEADDEGRFRFEDVPPEDRFVLHASAPGRVPSMAFDVPASGTEPVELILRPAARLFGRVQDPSEGPVSGVRVQLVDREQSGLLRIPVQWETSDQDGSFAFEGLPPGRYGIVLGERFLNDVELRAKVDLTEGEEHGPIVLHQENRAALEVAVVSPQHEPVVDASVSVQVLDGPRIEAPVGDEGKALFDDLTPGEVVISASHGRLGSAELSKALQPGHNEVSLILESGGQIRGRVIDPEGAPVSNAKLDLEPVDAPLSALAFSEPDGSFVLDVRSPGTYRLRVEARGWASTEYPELLEVGTQALEGIGVRLQKGADLVGHVQGLEPDELAHVTVSAESRSTRRRVQGAVSHDGRYRIEGLGSGRWKVTGELTEPRRVVQEPFVVQEEDERVELDLVFSEGYTLTGVVRTRDEPASGAILSLHGDGVEIEDRADGAGSFRFAGLEPGEYRLAVSLWSTDVYAERTVSITADRTLEVRLPTTRISGRLVSPDGEPVPRAQLHVQPMDDLDDPRPIRYIHSSATTEDDGRFVLPPVLEGPHRLIARVPSVGSVARAVEMVGARMDLGDVRVESGRTLSLQPRVAGGSRVEDLGVFVLGESRVFLGMEGVSVGSDGLARLPNVPEAAHSLVVFPGDAPGFAPVEILIPADAAQPVSVVFPVGSRILIRMAGTEPLRGGVKILDEESRAPPSLVFIPWDWFPIEGPEHTIDSLAPGSWTVELYTEDGKTQTRDVVTRPGETTEVVFGGAE